MSDARQPEKTSEAHAAAAREVAEAHKQLTELRDRLHDLEHQARIDEAIRRLESALNALAVTTGGLL